LLEEAQMVRRVLMVGLAVGLMAAAGCTPVQKGSTVGAVAGSGVGAAVGHSATSVGSGPGALAGLAIGAVGGAIAADYYYGPEETGDLAAANQTIEDLTSQLRAKDAQLAEASAAAEGERAQQRALLQAYDKARQDQKVATAAVPSNVQVTSDGETVTFTVLSGVLFASGKAELSKEGKATLKQTAAVIRAQYPGAQIEVRGHTDNEPIRYSSFKSNWDLSCARAVAVVHYMTETESFDAAQFTTVGYADARPVASNGTPEGRQKNRRAEIVVRPTKNVDVASVEALK
jgi:chemotaxis protein MotB